jgi:hypothetical protein
MARTLHASPPTAAAPLTVSGPHSRISSADLAIIGHMCNPEKKYDLGYLYQTKESPCFLATSFEYLRGHCRQCCKVSSSCSKAFKILMYQIRGDCYRKLAHQLVQAYLVKKPSVFGQGL